MRRPTWIRLPARIERRRKHRRYLREIETSPRRLGVAQVERALPREDEYVLVHAVWAVEAYTPRFASDFIRRLEALGFGRDEGLYGRRGLRASIESRRRSPGGGAWINLGTVFPTGTQRVLFGSGIERPLPGGVSCIRASLHMLTPSVTILVAQVVLEDEAAESYDRILRRTDFDQEVRTNRSGRISLVTADQQKTRVLAERRAELRDLAALWIRENLPGVFAHETGGHPIPTADLLTTEVLIPFAGSDAGDDFARFTDLRRDPLHWQNDELGPWRLRLDDDSPLVTFAARRPEVLASESYERMGRADEWWTLTYLLHESVDRDLALWGAYRLVLAYQAQLAAIRDRGLSGRSTRSWGAGRRLRSIRDDLVRDAGDAKVVATELKRYAAEPRDFNWQALDWAGSPDLPGRSDAHLLESLRIGVEDGAAAAETTELLIHDTLLIESNVVATLASLGIQWFLLALTMVALVVAAISLWVSTHTSSTPLQHPPARAPTTRSSH